MPLGQKMACFWL